MSRHDKQTNWVGSLATLPAGARIMLTAFLAIIGSGYLVAVLNIYHSHQMADGVAGMSLDDVRAVYSGMSVSSDAPAPSRMLTMIETTMREYVQDDDFPVLRAWLVDGGQKSALGDMEDEKSPRRAIMRNCLRCHAQETGEDIARTAPLAPDEWDVDYAMLSKFLSPHEHEDEDEQVVDDDARWVPPQYQIPRLVLVSHIHMLTIPMFTLTVGLLFMTTRLPPPVRGLLTPLPMIALVLDFGGWWLARASPGFVYAIAGAGAVFGLTFGIQVLAVTVELWRPARSRNA